MEKNTNLYVLNEVHKGAKMGMDSISTVSKKVSEPNFKDNLSFQYNQYGDILDSVNEIYKKYGDIPYDNNLMTDAMAWTGIQMNTLTDKSNSHIADMLIQGVTMGIIEGRKLLNQNPNIEQDVRQVLNTFIKMQENNVENINLVTPTSYVPQIIEAIKIAKNNGAKIVTLGKRILRTETAPVVLSSVIMYELEEME